jgi:hypothetical protein
MGIRKGNGHVGSVKERKFRLLEIGIQAGKEGRLTQELQRPVYRVE